MEKKLIKNIPDLFKLDLETLNTLDRLGPKSSKNLLNSLDASKNTTLPKFIYSLGIREVGEATALILSNKFEDIHSLLKAANNDFKYLNSDIENTSFIKLNDIGPRVARNIINFFNNDYNIQVVNDLLELGIRFSKINQNIKRIFENQVWVITGTLINYTRPQAKELIEAYGGKVSNSISRKTTFLLSGESSGSKLTKAENLGINIIDEDEFIRKMNS